MTVTEIRYGSGSVNHERVRRAMAEVGVQLEAERRQRVAVDHAEIVARGGHVCQGTDWRTGQPCEWGAVLFVNGGWVCQHHVPEPTRPAHDYGPHRPEDAPGYVTVLPRGKWPQPFRAAIHPAVLRQRQQINDIAHAAYQARRAASTHKKENTA